MRKLTTEEFIQKAQKIHGTKYDYSLVEYKKAHGRVKIICPEHGEFKQRSNNHLNGKGCPKCGQYSTKEEFIKKSDKIHNNKYDYSFVEYKDSKSLVKIICPEHGEFEQIPNSHLKGSGCKKCGYRSIAWNYLKHYENDQQGQEQGTFYIIKLYNEDEWFYKFGITKNSLKIRFAGKQYKNYKYKVIKLIKDTNYNCALMEKRVSQRVIQYIPKFSFWGHTECFKKVINNGKH